jgi:hypothetical protein
MTEKSPQMYEKKQIIIFKIPNILSKFDLLKFDGAIAQLVEHRTENPGVRGSIPRGTTKT